MIINLSRHAKKRMRERAILFIQIQETIDLPDYSLSKGSRKEVFKKFTKGTLRVIYSSEDRYINVITLMWK
jgi:hypothetical protein